MAKLLVVIGITGNQGGSVARVFLGIPGWRIRGVTRNISQPAAKGFQAQGVEIVQGDVNDVETIKAAVAGADVVFGNTVFPANFINPTDEDWQRLKPGQTLREWCYELEYSQGKNIADAVATVDGLQLFVWSSLSAAKKWSDGKYRGVYHFDSKADVVDYIHNKLPELAERMSILQMGLFIDNWRWGQAAVPWSKQPDGTLLLNVPGDGDIPIPLVIPSDAGYYVRAIAEVGPGKNVLAFSKRIAWSDYVNLWSKITGVPASFAKTTVAEHAQLAPGGYGEEMAEMYAYAQDFGYDGSDPSVIYAQDLGVDLHEVTTIEDYIRQADWSPLLK
ncbi:hypothetical protein LTR84_008651 [Exophiala bonariae]|uniref:NmrA-like domain-containing protein n=1 Tax=Exophiala bonariae TaxID=1690606 RepID=A0AAV9MY37_9EURO|nr:hypothetical protein LTR84_008651 [Exophiala bonariae]